MPDLVHLCRFNFRDVDFRRVGQVTDGGTALSGISATIESDGGGYWRGDFTNGSTRSVADGLAWRALIEGIDGVSVAIDVAICDTFFQPTNWQRPHHRDDTAPDALPTSADRFTSGAASLRATSIAIITTDPSQVQAGQTFAINHPTWGWRAYRIIAWDGVTAKFRPPIREAVAAATPIEFYSPRCRMHVPPGAAPSAPTNIGRFTSCSLVLVEDMRQPA